MQHEIHKWPQADYRYRIIVSQGDVSAIMTHLAEHLDYSNFKSMIAATKDQRGKLNAYREVWGVMAGLQK